MAFFSFIFGLLVGSFLNVVIFRIERNESYVGGRSRCLSCEHELAWYDNIPLLSFLFLRGKCRYCKIGLSWQYPAVEIATGILFLGSFLLVGGETTSFAQKFLLLWLYITSAYLVLISVYDLRFSLIPNSFLWGINIITILSLFTLHYFFINESFSLTFPSLSSSLWGALIGATFFFALVFFSRETWMGWGDVWLAFWAGMIVGIELLQIFITLAFGLGAVVGIFLLTTRKKGLKAEIPFAPYMLLAAVIIFLLLQYSPGVLGFLSPWLPDTI